MQELFETSWFPPLFAVGFMSFWLFAVYVIGLLSGWRELSTSYRAAEKPAGGRFRFKSANLRTVTYGSCLNLTANPEGIYIAVLPAFRLGHPPLFVPWEDVSIHKPNGWHFFSSEFRFARHPEIPFRTSGRLAEKLIAEAGEKIRRPEEGAG